VLNIKNKSHAVTAELVVPEGGAIGVILNQGGHSGGWSFYLQDGKPRYCYNLLGLQQSSIEADQGRAQATQPIIFSGDETTNVGRDTGSPVTTDNAFSGQINWVQLDLGTDSTDHLISPEARLRIGMARQ